MKTVLGVGQSPRASRLGVPARSLHTDLAQGCQPLASQRGNKVCGKKESTHLPCGIVGRKPSMCMEGAGGILQWERRPRWPLGPGEGWSQQLWGLSEHSWQWCHVNAPSLYPHEIQYSTLWFTKASLLPSAAFPSNPHNRLTRPGSMSPLYSRENRNSIVHGQLAGLKFGTSSVGLQRCLRHFIHFFLKKYLIFFIDGLYQEKEIT